MAQINLGKIRLTETELDEKLNQRLGSVKTELDEKLNQRLGNVKLGVDENGNPGYYKYDEEIGADTVIPFKGRSGGGGVLPIKGTICFAGTGLECCGGPCSVRFLDFFENPINISEITEIKTITNIESWMRSQSYITTTALTRQMCPVAYVKKNDDSILAVTDKNKVVNNSGASSITINLKEQIFQFDNIDAYKELIGFGCFFYLFPGGNSFSYYFRTYIGNVAFPNTGKMEYIIS